MADQTSVNPVVGSGEEVVIPIIPRPGVPTPPPTVIEQDGIKYYPYPHPNDREGRRLGWVELTPLFPGSGLRNYDSLDSVFEQEIAVVYGRRVELCLTEPEVRTALDYHLIQQCSGPTGKGK